MVWFVSKSPLHSQPPSRTKREGGEAEERLRAGEVDDDEFPDPGAGAGAPSAPGLGEAPPRPSSAHLARSASKAAALQRFAQERLALTAVLDLIDPATAATGSLDWVTEEVPAPFMLVLPPRAPSRAVSGAVPMSDGLA